MREKISAKRRIINAIMNSLVFSAALIIFVLVILMAGYILLRGLPHITGEFLTTKPSMVRETVGILPNILYIIIITIMIVLPLGVGGAVYLQEYASNKKAVKVIELATETLAGIPSIIYGLVGMLIFVQFFTLGTSLIAGALTLVTDRDTHNTGKSENRTSELQRRCICSRCGKMVYDTYRCPSFGG